jgi:hypothetical protein
MLVFVEAPSIAGPHLNLPVAKSNLAVDGSFVASSSSAGLSAPLSFTAGDVLLAKERGLESWHECEIIEQQGDLLTLTWSGLPDSEVFTRRIWQVGHIPRSRIAP